MGTQAYWRNRLLSFRDSVESPTGNSLWETCPLLAILSNPSMAFVFHEDWSSYNTTDHWTLTQATAGTGALSTAETGALVLDSGSSTTRQGAQIQRTGGPFIVPAANQDIWMEMDLMVTDTIDKVQLFAGLSEVDTTIIATDLNSSANHIGIESIGSATGAVTIVSEKATARGTATGGVLVEATQQRWGFHAVGVTSVQAYRDGVAVGNDIATAYVPIVKLVPSFVCQSHGTNDPILNIRGFTIVQLRP